MHVLMLSLMIALVVCMILLGVFGALTHRFDSRH
jgi:hypothetical protein